MRQFLNLLKNKEILKINDWAECGLKSTIGNSCEPKDNLTMKIEWSIEDIVTISHKSEQLKCFLKNYHNELNYEFDIS